MRRQLTHFLMYALSALAVPGMGFCGDDVRVMPVRFAVVFDKGDPIAGSATCTLGMECELLQTQLPSMEISLKVDPQDAGIISGLRLHCREECSFSNGRANLTFKYEREFAFYQDSEPLIRPLVLRPRVRIGRILLIYPKRME